MNLGLKEVFVVLATPQIERATRFYGALFAIAPHQEIPGVYSEFRLPGLKLGLFSPHADHQAEFAAGGGAMSLCLEVASLEQAIAQVQAAQATLAASDRATVPPLGAITTASHGREVYAYDLDGNRLILHEAHAASEI